MNEPRLILEEAIRNIRSSSSHAGVVVAAMPGMGTNADLKDIAAGSDIGFLDVRCSSILPSDLMPIPIVDGPIARTIRPNSLDGALAGEDEDRETLIVIDEPTSAMGHVGATVIRDAADAPGRPIVVSITTPDGTARTLKLMSDALGLAEHEIAVVMVPMVSSSDFADFLRRSGPTAVADFVEVNGFRTANPRQWSNFAAMVASENWKGLDEAGRSQIGRLTLGDEAYNSFVALRKAD